jgi:DNA processing protein
MIEREDVAGWLRLVETPEISLGTARRLLASFGSAEAVQRASRAELTTLISQTQADALLGGSDALDALIDTTWSWLNGHSDAPRRIVTLGDADYPPAWLEMADPPLLIYAIGRVDLLKADSVAIVGSRNPTPQGIENARNFAKTLSEAGFTIVSGLALGIDGAAHEGALMGPASTIAAVGTGLDRVYPRRHLALARRISREGLVLSEYPLGMPPLAPNFPRRNRLIAGLSRGTLVVEAALQSGSLITARLALDAGRDVFAIPGSIHAQQSRGCHLLIKQGAKLVETAADVLEELRAGYTALPRPEAADHEGDGDPLLAALGHDPVTLDALCARLGEPAAELSARLLELELSGEVARLPGQLFQRLVRA